MKVENLIPWGVTDSIENILKKELEVELKDYVQVKQLNGDDDITVFFKKLYIADAMRNKIRGVVALLEIGEFDDSVNIARDKVNLVDSITKLDSELTDIIAVKGLLAIIPNYN